jgi:phosphatidylinositol glycan class K
MEPSVPRSKRLLTDERSNIFVYMTGHGGNEFLKFQDNEEISAFDIADAFEQMYQKKRYVFTTLTFYFRPSNKLSDIMKCSS